MSGHAGITLGGEYSDAAYTLTSGADGAWTIAGGFALTCDMDPGPGDLLFTAIGNGDAFVQRIDAGTVGMMDHQGAQNLVPYPNPFSDVLTIELPIKERYRQAIRLLYGTSLLMAALTLAGLLAGGAGLWGLLPLVR